VLPVPTENNILHYNSNSDESYTTTTVTEAALYFPDSIPSIETTETESHHRRILSCSSSCHGGSKNHHDDDDQSCDRALLSHSANSSCAYGE
jgi:hypothetical protein